TYLCSCLWSLHSFPPRRSSDLFAALVQAGFLPTPSNGSNPLAQFFSSCNINPANPPASNTLCNGLAGLILQELKNCARGFDPFRSEEHTSELQSRRDLVCRLLL